ncbi:MAG: GIY-YIG nuclease family protein [Candidatus Omnitrophota bacterium]|nr:GIY-YIG nuclease family protein [Candidatus Omnitrophota bacterium]
MKYYVYVLTSKKFPERCYVGITKNLKERIKDHNSGESSYSKKYGPWELRTSISFKNRNKAEEFEKYLKSGSGFSFLKKRLI